MKKLPTILLLLSVYTVSLSQNISRHEADSLRDALGRSQSAQARINVLLKIAKYHIFKPGEVKADLDSGMVFINEAEQVNNKVNSRVSLGNILLHKAYYLKEARQQDLAIAAAEKAVAALQKGMDQNLLGEAYFELSEHYSYDFRDSLVKKISLVQQAVACFTQAGTVERKGYCYKVLGDLFIQLNDKVYNKKAIEALDSSLQAYQSIGYPELQGVYILYSTIYAQESDHRKALHYALVALQTAERIKDTSIQLCQINNGIGMLYVYLREYEKAYPYLLTSLSIAEKYNDINSIYLLEYNICTSYIEINRATQAKALLDRIVKKYPEPNFPWVQFFQTRVHLLIAEQLNQLNDLKYYCNRMEGMFVHQEVENTNTFGYYNAIIKGFLKLKNYSKARIYLRKEQDILQRIPFSIRNTIFYKSWFSLDTATGDYKSAVYHLLENNKANDTIFNQAKELQIQQLEIEYKTAEQKKNIELLNVQKKNQAEELKRTALVRNIIFATAALLLIILFLLFSQFRLKQRSSMIVQNKNAVLQRMVTEKEWLLKEVHHRVKNNLQTVVSLLELQSENLRDEALSAIHDSQNRIYAMSLIHQKLYQTDNIASINMQPYLLELVDHLQAIYNPERKIHFDMQVTSLELDVSQAIPVGLIVNEAVTNSIKYAFHYTVAPQITIVLKQNMKKNIKIIVADNGIGLPSHFDINAATGLGFKLMHGLVTDIVGELAVTSEHGTQITVIFNASVPFDEKLAIPEAEHAFAV